MGGTFGSENSKLGVHTTCASSGPKFSTNDSLTSELVQRKK